MLGRREVWGPGETGRSDYGVDGTRGYAPLRFSRCICLNLRILIPDPTCGRSLCFRLMQVYPALRGARPSIMPSGSPPASHVFGSSPTSETDSTISEEDPMRLTSLTSNLTSGATATILGDLGHKVAIPIPQRLAPIRPSLQLFLPLAPGTGLHNRYSPYLPLIMSSTSTATKGTEASSAPFFSSISVSPPRYRSSARFAKSHSRPRRSLQR